MGRLRRFRRKVLGASTVHRFHEIVQQNTLACVGSSNAAGIIKFQISDLTNWAYYQQLFDLYKITAVKVKLVPKWSTSDVAVPNSSGTAGGSLPMLYIAENRDPYVPAPASAADVLNDDQCKILRLTAPMNLYLKSPKPDITNGGGNIPMQFGVGSKYQPWLTTGGNSQTVNQENVSHYGFRWWIANGGNYEVDIDVYITYFFSLKESD